MQKKVVFMAVHWLLVDVRIKASGVLGSRPDVSFLLREMVLKLGRFFWRIRRSDVDILNLPKQNRHPPQLWPAPMDGTELQRFQAGETLRISPVGFPFTHHCK